MSDQPTDAVSPAARAGVRGRVPEAAGLPDGGSHPTSRAFETAESRSASTDAAVAPAEDQLGGASPADGAAVDIWSIAPPATNDDAPATIDLGGTGTGTASASGRPRRSRPPRTDWRLGGRTVYLWRENLLAIALLSLGGAALAGAAIEFLWQSPWAAASATALVWIGMLVPVVWAFTRSRPVGLLRLRPLDLLYGLVLGVILRTVQGWVEGTSGGAAPFPSYTRIGGDLPSTWALTELVGPIVVAPAVEELFFRAVVLVALYTVLRRPLGRMLAGASALLASTALFVVVHALSGEIDTAQIVSLTLLGLVCGLLVLLTGRIWGAVLVHAVYNTSFVVLALAGTVVA